MKWLLRMLGLRRPEPPAELERVKRRSDAVLAKTARVLAEVSRQEQMRDSFIRANRRLAR